MPTTLNTDLVAQTLYFDSDGDNTAQTIKAAETHLFHLEVSNANATATFIQLFDATSPTVGTTVPKQSFFVPGPGAMDKHFNPPLLFSTALVYACTTTATGSTDPTLGVVVNAGYV